MMALDPENNLDTWPLVGLDKFINKCNERGVKDVFVTGTNTDPLLFKHARKLAFPTKSDIDRSHAEISCYGRDYGREFLKKEITNAYEQGASDTRSKFYDQVKDLFTSQEFSDIFNGNRKPKEQKSYKEQSNRLNDLRRAEHLFMAGDTARSVRAILDYLINLHE